MSELEKCKKKIDKCDQLIQSGKNFENFRGSLCNVIGNSVGMLMAPLFPFAIAFDCADTAKTTNSKLSKAIYYTGAGLSGVLGVALVAPSALVLGSTYLSVAGVKTARDFRNKQRLNKLVNKKQSLEEELTNIELGLN